MSASSSGRLLLAPAHYPSCDASGALRLSEPDKAVAIPLGDVLAHHAARGDRPALTHDGLTLRYSELDARANRRARLFKSLGVGHDDLVLLALPNSIEFFESTFALWKLGATPCPVSPKLTRSELDMIIETVKPRLVVGGESAAATQLSAGVDPGAEFSTEAIESRIPACWKAITSGGSTGRPKVILTHVAGTTDPQRASYALQQARDIILNPGPLYHNAAFSSAHQCLFAGGQVVNMERFDAERSLQLIQRHRVQYTMMVPTMMSRIWHLPAEVRESYDLSSLRTVLHLGAPCPTWLKERWIEWLGPERIVEAYAGTEGVGATSISGTEWLQHKGSVGRAAGGAEMRVLDADGRECAAGVVGEIYFRPPQHRRGNFSYLGASAKQSGDWVSLGDLGHVDEAGYLYLADRRTDVVISGGVNIYPAEVENALGRHPDVRSCVVIGLPDDDLGNRAHAIVQLADEARNRIDAEALAEFLKTHLVRYKIPRSYEFVSAELRDDAGKARRLQLREERMAALAVTAAENPPK
jgi:bile acid-coenzyme A ligase